MRHQDIRIYNRGPKKSNSRTVSCFMMSPRHPRSHRVPYLRQVARMKSTDIVESYRGKKRKVNSNCPLLYFWMYNNQTVDHFINKGLMPVQMRSESPFNKTRYLFQQAWKRYVTVDEEVIQIMNVFKQSLLNYYQSHSGDPTVTLDSFHQFIGLHIRMGYPLADFTEVTTFLYMDDLPVVVNYVRTLNPSYPIFLASDSIAAKRFFSSEFGDRLVFYNTTNSFSSDRLINRVNRNKSFLSRLVLSDMLLLSQSSYLVGTDYSTFSTMASFLGNCQTVYVKKNSTVLCDTCHSVNEK